MNNIVLDNGSSLLKAGISGTDIAPSIFCPTLIGIPVTQQESSIPIPALLGLDALKKASHYSLRYPVQRGMIIDFEDCVQLWRYVLQLAIGDNRPDSLLVTQPALNPKKNRELSLQYAFELLQTSRFYLSSSPGLVLYANGKSTGSIVQIGDGVTNIAAIADGYIGPTSMAVNQIAGRQISQYLGDLIFEKHRIAFVSSIEKEIVRQMKEKHAYLKGFEQCYEERKLSPKSKKDLDNKCLSYYLPDNQQIKISEGVFSQASQALFNPLGTLQRDIQPIPHVLAQIISESDINLQRKLNENIYLAGGTSLMRGLPQRFYHQYSALMKNSNNNKKIQINATETRNISSWIGGAIISQLSSFQSQWVTVQDYKQYGANVVHSKCAL